MSFDYVEHETNKYLDEQARAEQFDDACTERQEEITTAFLEGANEGEETEEIFCDITTTAQFSAALQTVFKAQSMRELNKSFLEIAVVDLFRICHAAAMPHFESRAQNEIEAEQGDAGQP